MSNAKSAPNLITRNPVFSVGNQPYGAKPFIQAKRAILEDRTDLDRELLFAGFTAPNKTGLDKPLLRPAAMRAYHPIRPTEAYNKIMSVLFISEVNHSFLKCFWFFICHLDTSFRYCVFSILRKSLCVKYTVTNNNLALIVLVIVLAVLAVSISSRIRAPMGRRLFGVGFLVAVGLIAVKCGLI